DLARLLQRNGIEVRRTTASGKTQAAEIVGQTAREYTIPANTFIVPLNQPASRLALTLLERHQPMAADYIKRQEDRVKRGLPDEFYDVTAWSLPLAFDVPCLTSAAAPLPGEPFRGEPAPGAIVGQRPRIGYVLAGDDDAVLPALAQWLSQGLRVQVFSEPTKINGVAFPRGSLLLRVADNPESLHDAVAGAVKAHGLTVHAVDNAFVDEGAGLGGPYVHWVRPPRVLLTVDRPASYGVGHAWYAFDQVWRYPVTRVAGRHLPAMDWYKFDVAVLPHGNYKGAHAPSEDVVRRLKDWVHEGGTLILVGGAAEWATGEKVKLLPSKLEPRPSADAKPNPPATSEKREDQEEREKRLPVPVPGAFLKARVDDDHFVTWGLSKDTVLPYNGNRLFVPLKEHEGRNLVTFADKDALVSGYCWPETLQLMSGKPYVMYRSLGRGHVVAFADDPTYRAFSPQLQRLFFNAVFFSLPAKRSR
ncbi:MAG: hypothetical protein JNM56_05880, partial [Planctomycetia bacterium]|nr:hypothetical protein [Planctomycetia bacterium]